MAKVGRLSLTRWSEVPLCIWHLHTSWSSNTVARTLNYRWYVRHLGL